MNLNISGNLSSLAPPGFVFRGQPGLAPNRLFGFGGTQTLVPVNPGNNIPITLEAPDLDCLIGCNKQLPIKKRSCRQECRRKSLL